MIKCVTRLQCVLDDTGGGTTAAVLRTDGADREVTNRRGLVFHFCRHPHRDSTESPYARAHTIYIYYNMRTGKRHGHRYDIMYEKDIFV